MRASSHDREICRYCTKLYPIDAVGNVWDPTLLTKDPQCDPLGNLQELKLTALKWLMLNLAKEEKAVSTYILQAIPALTQASPVRQNW